MIIPFGHEIVAFRYNHLYISIQEGNYTRSGNDLVTTDLPYNALIYLLK